MKFTANLLIIFAFALSVSAQTSTQILAKANGQNFTIANLQDRAAVFYKQGSLVGNQFKQNLTAEGIN